MSTVIFAFVVGQLANQSIFSTEDAVQAFMCEMIPTEVRGRIIGVMGALKFVLAAALGLTLGALVQLYGYIACVVLAIVFLLLVTITAAIGIKLKVQRLI